MIRGLLNRGNMPGTFLIGPDFISKSLYLTGRCFCNPLIFIDILISLQLEEVVNNQKKSEQKERKKSEHITNKKMNRVIPVIFVR